MAQVTKHLHAELTYDQKNVIVWDSVSGKNIAIPRDEMEVFSNAMKFLSEVLDSHGVPRNADQETGHDDDEHL